MAGIAITLYVSTTLQAQPDIPKDFILKCQQKSISNAYATFKAIIDKTGKPRCQGIGKTVKPHCPKGYSVLKRSCVKSLDRGLEKSITTQ